MNPYCILYPIFEKLVVIRNGRSDIFLQSLINLKPTNKLW